MNHTFENFVVGHCNRAAFEAAIAVADGTVDVPVFIYGASGLGKTHLLRSVAAKIRKGNPACRVFYVRGDELVVDAVAALRLGHIRTYWDSHYYSADVLLLDDVEFVGGRAAIQEEMLRVFEQRNKKIIICSNRAPEELFGLQESLKDYFLHCKVVAIQPPDYETRVAIIQNKAACAEVELPEEVVVYIAERMADNVRQIEGTINKIVAYIDLIKCLEASGMDIKDLLKV